jgi:hypothetical protein
MRPGNGSSRSTSSILLFLLAVDVVSGRLDLFSTPTEINAPLDHAPAPVSEPLIAAPTRHRHPHSPSQVTEIPTSEESLICFIVEHAEIFCSNNATYVQEARDAVLGFDFWLHLGLVIALVLFAGMVTTMSPVGARSFFPSLCASISRDLSQLTVLATIISLLFTGELALTGRTHLQV